MAILNNAGKTLAIALMATFLAAPTVAGEKRRQHWYWTVTPAATQAQVIYIGPYNTLAGCRDMLGSAIFSHPWGCHLGWQPASATCRNIGNGFAYPANYPYPIPTDMQITGQDCVQNDNPGLRLRSGWYFLYYTIMGGGVAACREHKKFEALAEITPGMELGYYDDRLCPGAPCFSIGSDTACN